VSAEATPEPRRDGSRRIVPWTVLVTAAVALLAGYLLKERCTRHEWDGYQFRTSCYNDIYALYFHRGLDREPVPYVNGDGELSENEVGDLEYPVVTGFYIGTVALVTSTPNSYFQVTAAGLALAGMLAVGGLLLLARDPARVLTVAAGSSLVLYAFHNWDLLAVMFMVAGLVAFRMRKDVPAGALIGLGAAAKVFPGLILPALVLARRREERRWPVEMIVASAFGFILPNAPVLAANPAGWLVPWRFQGTRFPNFETSWYFVYKHLGNGEPFWGETYPGLTSMLAGGLFLAGAGLLLWRESKRVRFRPYATSFGLLLVFLLTAKVYSPQFSLWVLPFFALVRVRWYAWLAFLITDAAVWAAISAYFLAASGRAGATLVLVEVAVVARYLVLAWLLWLSRRADENVAPAVLPEPAMAT